MKTMHIEPKEFFPMNFALGFFMAKTSINLLISILL